MNSMMSEAVGAGKSGVHPFERAGLGKAPFRFIGVEVRRGPMPILDANGRPTGAMAGSPGQPMGTCSYCGQGIAECCFIKSADGNVFMVGNVCVGKTRDKRLSTETERAVRKMRKESKTAALKVRVEATWKALDESPELREKIAASGPHPNPFFAERGATMLDYVAFLLEKGGEAGRAKACKMVEKIKG